MLVPLLIATAGLLYFMTAEERVGLMRTVFFRLRQAQDGARQLADYGPLDATLRARTPWALITPMLLALNVMAFVAILVGPGSLGDSETLVRLGGNFAPRTTTGEWGRLFTSTFVHGGVLGFAIDVAALVSVGLILERLVGPLTFLAVYLAAGVLAGLVSLASSFVAVTAGASPSIFGLYGLLLATWTYGAVQGATTTIRLPTARRLAPMALVFVAYSLTNQTIPTSAEMTGLATGFVAGLILGRYVSNGRPPARQVAMTIATTAIIAVVTAAPLRGVSDVSPMLAEVVTLESRTVRGYQESVELFRKGRMTGKALAGVIDKEVLPEFPKMQQLLGTLVKVPPEHKPLVAAADTYLRLRQESWQIRADALRLGSGSVALLREADLRERGALDALGVVRRR